MNKKYKKGGGILPMGSCNTKSKLLMAGGEIDMAMIIPMKTPKMKAGGKKKMYGYGGPVKKMNMGGRTNGSRTYSGK